MQEQVKAVSKFVRISPRKARLVLPMLKNIGVDMAVMKLSACCSKAGRLVLSTLNSAVANAQSRFSISRSELVVISALINEGPRMKRARGRSRGGKTPILKRTSHITVIVGKN